MLVRTVVCEFDAMEKEKKLARDAFCRQDADHSCMVISEQEIDLPWVGFPNNDEPDADAVPFQPRLLQGIIIAHCPLPQPCLRGNLLCRADWLSLRGGENGLRVCDPADSRNCHPLKVQCGRTCQLRGAHHGAPFPAGACQQVLLAAGRKRARQCSIGVEKRRIRSPIRGNFLHEADWLFVRGVADTECNILSIRILANF